MNKSNKDELKKNAVSLLKEMIATQSFSREEDQVSDLMFSRLENLGLKPDRYLKNVFLKNQHFDPTKPTILLNSHLDTVKPNSGYTLDPFAPTEIDGKLFGLGSNDAGGAVVGLLSTFLYFDENPNLKFNLVYASSVEEEISGANGIEALLPHLRTKQITPAFALVGEPTGMQMAVAEKGLLVLDCVALGRSGHAARDEGDNAIYKAVQDIHWFKDFKFEQVSPLLGPNKMTVTLIQSGTQHNVVPRECKFTVDVRVNELYDFDTVLKTIQEKVRT